MLLAIDVGNSNINLGLFKEKELRLVCTLSTDPSRTADQYAVEIRGAMKLRGGDLSAVTGAVIGSVVPALTSVLKNAVSLLCGVDALILGPGVKYGLDVRIDEPSQLGADLIAGAVGALDVGHEVADEVFYCVKGTVLCYVPEDDKYYRITEGDAMLVTPGLGHKLYNIGETTAVLTWSCAPHQ